jgi:hypothetical protein
MNITLQMVKPQNCLDCIRVVSCLNSCLQLKNFNYASLKKSKVQ